MRALVAAAIGLVPVLLFVLLVSLVDLPPDGPTSSQGTDAGCAVSPPAAGTPPPATPRAPAR
ncbi:SPW_0924 family protein [Streptomyces hydrogenans]|uniref:SPW_0924 family protein n=1 Tax=Streptomyces hydrogenans TaxID=1873719 RepID=UPI0037FBA768